MRMVKSLFFFVLALLLAPSGIQAASVKVGIILPYSGPSAQNGQQLDRGMELYVKLHPKPSETVIQKHRYSAFVGTEFGKVLQEKGIKTLILTGVTTNVCVESTARDAFMRDYYVVFLNDCTATYSQEAHESTLSNFRRHFGVVVGSGEVVAIWRGENRA